MILDEPTAALGVKEGNMVLNPKKISMSDTVAVMTGALAPDQIPAECLAG